MANSYPIEPFPDSIDREHFASWLSGFTDGEGCFWLGFSSHRVLHYRVPYASFQMGLRADDLPVMRLIHSYFGAGRVHDVRPPTTRRNNKPSVRLQIACVADLLRVVVPHFERYPLFAKKRRDFVLWSQGVALMGQVVPRQMNQIGRRMFHPKWRPEELESFRAISDALRSQRQYASDPETQTAAF